MNTSRVDPRARPPRPRRAAGYALFEALVAVIVLSVGFVGAARMQTVGLKLNNSAHSRQKATLLAYQMADRIRANALGDYVDAVAGDPTCLGTTAGCTPLAMVGADIAQWQADLAAQLPSGAGVVCRDSTNPNDPAANFADPRCDGAGDVAIVRSSGPTPWPRAARSLQRRCVDESHPQPRPCGGGRRHRGFTLVELMVGLAVGLFVSVVAISLFVSTRKLQTVNSSSNRMSENARLAFDLLHKDLRLAGFRGCSDTFDRDPVSVLNNSTGAFLDDAAGMRGHRGTGSGFNPALPPALSGLVPAPRNNSDVISLRVPVDAASLGMVTSMVANTSVPNVGTNTGGANLVGVGDVVMISNCKRAALFQVTGTASPAVSACCRTTWAAASPPATPAPTWARASTRTTPPSTASRPAITTSPERRAVARRHLLAVAGDGADAGRRRRRRRSGSGHRAAGRELRARRHGRRRPRCRSLRDGRPRRRQLEQRAECTHPDAGVDHRDGTAQAASSVAFAGGTVSAGDKRLREVYSEVVAFRNQLK